MDAWTGRCYVGVKIRISMDFSLLDESSTES